MLDIKGYENAKDVFDFFAKITAVPRPSGLRGPIAEYLCDFARERGLEFLRDDADNVIIKKPATAGYEDRPTVIMQGHTDIVAEKTQDKIIDMEKCPPEIFVDGDFIKADRTTLGGDDGVALAYMLALLNSSDIPHPNIECIFTSDEEIGLLGAAELDTSSLKGHTMINIDSDAEGVFTVGCAGGMRLDITENSLEIETIVDKYCYKIEIGGLLGGHSGIEIDKGRINANKLMGALLSELTDIAICNISGGNADNAIPRDCCAVIAAKIDISDALEELKSKYLKIVKAEDGYVNYTEVKCDRALTKKDTKRVIELINDAPCGVVSMSSDIEGLVQTSLNLGIIRVQESANITFSLRSSKNNEKRQLKEDLFALAEKYGFSASTRGEYPAWEYNKGTHLEKVLVETYTDIYGKRPEVVTIHAGLECGIFAEKIKNLECVSLGPNNYDIHTPEERLSISSTVRVWEFLLELIKKI